MASPAAFIHGADGTVLRDILISGLVSRAAWKWWQSNNEGSAAESTAASLSEAKATATDTATDTDTDTDTDTCVDDTRPTGTRSQRRHRPTARNHP